MNILSIQSHVVFGHAGNAAAVFPMQRLGAEVWPIHTVQFSNHTEYGHWTGQVFEAAHVQSLVEGIAARGCFETCDAVLSGYMGDVSLGEVILDAVKRAKAANPEALYLCDPVMGNPIKGCVVRPEIPPFMKAHTVPAADIATPSSLELEVLSGITVRSFEDVLTATRQIHALGPRIVVVKGLRYDTQPASSDQLLVSSDEGIWVVTTPHFPIEKHLVGAGDLIAGTFLVNYLQSRLVAKSLERAAECMYAVAEATYHAKAWELQIVAAQEQLVNPTTRFSAEKIA